MGDLMELARRLAGQRMSTLRRRLAPGSAQSRADMAALVARIEELEEEVQENRRLNRRVAELTDLVTELLVPLSQRDNDKVEELLESYRSRL